MNIAKFDAVGYFSKPRFEVMLSYPEPKKEKHFKKGEIVGSNNAEMNAHFEAYPHIFRPLKWYELRTMDEMIKIKFIEVVKPSYYIKGAKVAVTSYEFGNLHTTQPFIKSYRIGGSVRSQDQQFIGGHYFTPEECLPANEGKLISH